MCSIYGLSECCLQSPRQAAVLFVPQRSGQSGVSGVIVEPRRAGQGAPLPAIKALGIPLAFLAPGIIKAIHEGEQPVDLSAVRLTGAIKLPLDWNEQQRLLCN